MRVSNQPFVISEFVRWGDVDLAGIICYGAYIRFFELAETELFREAGLPFSRMFDGFDMWLPRKIMHAEFHSPALLDERLNVVTYISAIGNTSLTINFEVCRKEGMLLRASAYQVLVCVSRGGLVKKSLPAEVVAALQKFTMTQAEARAAVGAVLAN